MGEQITDISRDSPHDTALDSTRKIAQEAAQAALWRKYGENKSTRRDILKKGTELAAVAGVASVLGGVTIKDYVEPFLSPTEPPTLHDNNVTIAENGHSFEAMLTPEIQIIGQQNGWTTSFQVDQLYDNLQQHGNGTLTIEGRYNNAIVDELPSATIDPTAPVEKSVQTSANASIDFIDGSRRLSLHLLPLTQDNKVRILTSIPGQKEPTEIETTLISQVYEKPANQSQRVLVEVGNGTEAPILEDELFQMQLDAEAIGILGLDAKIFISTNPPVGKILYRTDGIPGMGVTVKKEAFSKDRPYEDYGQMLAFHQMARNAVEKLTNEEVHSRYVISQITDQLDITTKLMTEYEGSLSERRAVKKTIEQDAKPNILDITFYFPNFDGELRYYDSGEPTATKTVSLGGINEQLISLIDIIKFVDIADFTEAFQLLDTDQQHKAAAIIRHSIFGLESAVEDRGTLDKLLPSLQMFKGFTNDYS